MAKIHVLVRGSDNESLSVHGVAEDDLTADVWEAAHPDCGVITLETETIPSTDPEGFREEPDEQS